ncbi:protelomerase family protein [Anabaena cylindrica UHCC 0172]|uniref:protelomerase family protein n=1 Tax=Anabaena cylindrica TaxID=1165 RepID=UPI002B203B4B|nr:protelomerase family protein [Anabaena cylindrica]MEA5551654.1 protelomerase family protein [Anabaena cylindrica UHCC 0172]
MSQQLKTEQDLENTFVDDRVKILLPQFEAIAPYKLTQRKKGVGDLTGWHKLAIQEARLLKLTYPDEKPEDEKEYGTVLRQITAIKKYLKLAAKTELKDAALFNPVNTIITHFGNELSNQFAIYKENQNTRYRETVKERRKVENRIEIDLTNSLKYAYNILTDIKNGKDDTNWLDVSCAIALSTGRRMAEVHLSASFEQIDGYKIIFTGQLKGKDRKVRVQDRAIKLIDVPFTIPTLLPADLVCFGLNWLNSKGKRFSRDEDPERVNRRFSKTLNQACKDWDIFPVEDRTYHKFRAAYLRAAIINDGNVDPYDFTDFAKEVLGDDDEATINAYKRYGIKSGSVTKI